MHSLKLITLIILLLSRYDLEARLVLPPPPPLSSHHSSTPVKTNNKDSFSYHPFQQNRRHQRAAPPISLRNNAQNLQLYHQSRWQQFQDDDKASKFQSLANKVGTVADIALDYGLLLLKPDPVSIAVALGVTALGVGLYYGFRWYKRREVPEGYASRQVLPLQIGTGRPLYALKPQKSSTAAVFTAAALPQLLPADSVRPQSPQSILSNSFNSTFSFCMVVLFIFALNLFLLLLFTTLQNPPPKLKQRSSLFQKKQSSRRKQSSRFKRVRNSSSKTGEGRTKRTSSK